MRKLTTLAVACAILVLGHALCCAADPAELTPKEIWAVYDATHPASVTLPAVTQPRPADHFADLSNMVLPIVDATPKPSQVLTEADLDADSQPTPMGAVGAGLKALDPKPGEVLVDYGCGFDARWLIVACRDYGVQRAVGVEIDPRVADSARAYVAAADLSDRITIITGDSTKVNVQADIGVAYLWPETLTALRPKIEGLNRFVSYSHPLPWVNDKPIDSKADVFLYGKPAEVAVVIPPRPQVQLVRPSAAVWNGRTYTHAVCNRRGCTMCAAIRAQLAPRYQTVPATQATQQAAPAASGRWVTFKQCVNGRCTTYKRWVPN